MRISSSRPLAIVWTLGLVACTGAPKPAPTPAPIATTNAPANATTSASASETVGVAPVPSACPEKCTGTVTDELKKALGKRGGVAGIPCFKAALDKGEVEGKVSIVVRIAADGRTCATSVADDTTGSAEFVECVRKGFVTTYPPPSGGCVVVRVPIDMKIKSVEAPAESDP
jgi:hypothetical protein